MTGFPLLYHCVMLETSTNRRPYRSRKTTQVLKNCNVSSETADLICSFYLLLTPFSLQEDQ